MPEPGAPARPEPARAPVAPAQSGPVHESASFLPGLTPPAWRAPWFAAFEPTLSVVAPLAAQDRWPDCLEHLNRMAAATGLLNEAGRAIRFVDASQLTDVVYETHIWATGQVPTRLGGDGGWHDLFNALCWLAFPVTKARLNALQAARIGREGVGARRGGLRDAATLFDENAALFLTADRSFADALRAFDWNDLFVRRREAFSRDVRVLAFGHALVDKLRRPFKSICAHAWILVVPAPMLLRDPLTLPGRAEFDRLVAAGLDEASLRTAEFAPLPVLGIPGWWDENSQPAFYEDASVFRPGRRDRGRNETDHRGRC